MTDTANLGLPFIDGSQAQKHVTHNEALRILDAAIQIGVLDTALTTPPSSPVEGERHVVATGATGVWAGQAKTIATYEDATWRFLMPKLGWCVWSAADSVIFVFDGASWRDLRDLPVSLDTVGHLGINATATSPNLLSVKSNAALFNAIAAADSGTGDVRLQLSKESSTKTASIVFSDAFSGRAEFGLVGSDAFKLKVSNDGATFVEAFNIDQSSGNLTLPRGVILCGVIAPSQITSNQNDYAPTGFSAASVVRISTDASRNITGLAGGAEGRTIIFVNAGGNPAVLKDESTSSTAANRFGFGNDLTLAAKQGATLVYDGNASRWRQIGGPSSSSVGSGATDTERQNSLLNLIYQSKTLAGYRRLVNLFADGFKASDGINAGSSSNYSAVTASGYVAPTTSGGDLLAAQTLSANNAGWDGYTIRQRVNSALLSSVTGSSGTITISPPSSGANLVISDVYIGYAAASGNAWDFDGGQVRVQFSGSNGVTLTAGGSDVVSDVFTLTADSTKNLILAVRVTSGDIRVNNALTGATFYNKAAVNEASASTPSGYSSTTSRLGVLKKVSFTGGSANNMTLVTAAQSADSSVSNGRVLIEYDNTATPALNTDLTVEVTCNGGTNWTSATLVAVTSYGQGGRKVAETADTACTSGTSFAARIKTLNNKNVPIYGTTLTVR